MIATRAAMTLAFGIGALISTAAAFDSGQWNDVPDHCDPGLSRSAVPAAVAAVTSPMGIALIGKSARLAFIPNPTDPTGVWILVPPEVVVHNAGNPIGEAIVWWNTIIIDEDQTGIFIRCFVPSGGV